MLKKRILKSMKRVLIYVVFCLIILGCNNKNKNTKEDTINYNELLKDIHPKKNKKPKDDIVDDSFCDINLLNEINKDIKKISYSKIESYLLSINDSCKNNAEYSAYNNETLFNLLNTHSKHIIDILAKNKKINKAIVLEEISNPISDTINLERLIDKIKELNASSAERREVLKALSKGNN